MSLYTQSYELSSPFLSEKAFVDTVCLWLEGEGWYCQRGQIDILATKDHLLRLIEAKNAWDRYHCATALGQLLMSAPAYPNAILLLATPRRPSPDVLGILARYHVTLLHGPWL